jgi:polysaccharide chain length determinant protein (PEP-CTERM system associated)
MDSPRFHPLDYLSVVQRRKWWLAVPMVLALLVGAALAVFLPREYLSSTTIGITSATVSPDVAKVSAPFDRDERMRAISQQLLSKSVLSRVAREEHLATDDAALDGAIARLRANVQPVTLPQPIPGSDNSPADAFILSYVDGSPDRAQRIAARLAEVFVDETSRRRELRAQGTTQFLSNQLALSKTRLSQLEDRLTVAKRSYMGRLPEQSGANLQTLNGLRQQLEANGTALRSEQDRLSMLDQQMAAMRQGMDAIPLVRGGGEAPSPSSPQARVLSLQRQLADARMVYTDKHPEIIRLQEELKNAKAEAAAERSRPESDRLALLKSDPTYRQLLADQEVGRMRVRELQRAEAQTRSQIAQYQQRVESAPLVEQQLVALQRDYELEKRQYEDLSARRDAATLSEDLERKQAGERFRVLSPATWPREPFKPNLLRILMMAIVAGGFLGGVSAVGREFLDRSIYDAHTLQHEYDLPVLGEISRIRAA